ncbi:bifunctional serine/threonine-protein kinase/ABC transporter substrate-binding protein [Streptomyces mayteni]
MRDLELSDPRRIGGYRLLRRIADGRTGVVYLARSLGGAPAALKVIRREHARDPEFRARFERDVAAARHVSARCLVGVLAADTAGGTMWAAFPYVPGPTLAETVAAHGPLPRGPVRTVGAMLAEALAAVHQAGLVHQDVRPGHVQLVPDGPRLTGFGGTGTVGGTPGYQSPEQARGGATPPGPGTDVFSLGCVLAYVATGRHPFGTGTGRELLHRVVHEPADLADVPRSLLEVIEACLAKDPMLRPTAADLRAELADAGDAAGVGHSAGWLPSAVAADVNHRFHARLPAPGPELSEWLDPEPPPPARPPRAAQEPPPEPAPEPMSSRRRVLTAIGGAGALLLGGALTARLLLPRSGGAASAEGRGHYAIGLHADLTGPHAKYGKGQRRGVTMAVEELNSLGDLGFSLSLREVDDGGDAERAAEVARSLIADPAVMAVIGPTADAVARAAADAYGAAGMPLFALSAGNFEPRAAEDTLLLGRPDTGTAAGAIPLVLAQELGARRVGLIDDRTADEYSWLVTRAVSDAVDRATVELTPRVLPAGTRDFAEVAAEFTAAGVDAVVYGGLADGAGRLAGALAEAGYQGSVVATQEALGATFFELAGEAAAGWYFVTTYTDPIGDPDASGFATVHRGRFGGTVEPYAVEAYDATRMLVDAMRALAGEPSGVTKGALLTRLRDAEYHGLGRDLAFDAAGGYAGEGPLGYLYKADANGVRFRRPLDTAAE